MAVLTPTERMSVYTSARPAMDTPAVEPAYVPPGRLLACRDGKPMTTIVSTGAVLRGSVRGSAAA